MKKLVTQLILGTMICCTLPCLAGNLRKPASERYPDLDRRSPISDVMGVEAPKGVSPGNW